MSCIKEQVFKIQLLILMICIIQIKFSLANNVSDIKSIVDDFSLTNNTDDLFHANFHSILQSSVDNASSELVVKKNLFLFPVNDPNLVISQKHEIHIIPEENAKNQTNITDSEPVTDLQEINEVSLSKLVPDNYTDNNETVNNTVIEDNFNTSDPKILEVVSGYKPESGLVTKEIPLPKTISNTIALPQNSIVDLLSVLNDTENESRNNSTTQDSLIAKREANDFSEVLDSDNSSSTSLNSKKYDHTNNNEAIDPGLKSLTSKELNEDMEVAEDIVFRPLFRYRQEAVLRPQYSDDSTYRRSSFRQRNRYRNNYDSDYNSRYRYRSRSRSDDDNDYN